MAEANEWEVGFHRKAQKQKQKLPVSIVVALDLLVAELRVEGPERTNWHHCHLNKGKPCYVAVWKVIDRQVQMMEVRYVETHENANYRRID